VVTILRMEGCEVFRCSLHRPSLRFTVLQKPADEQVRVERID
jgi:superfamily II DNA helicase RecQ